MMNWADARMISGSHLRTARLYAAQPQPTVASNPRPSRLRAVENRGSRRKMFALSQLGADSLRVSLKCEPQLAQALRGAH